ncbi:GNAT family N-acetyltransferase [Rhodohalobacter sp. SW132]|uniref:GNAT family N-acetyltransferase n=1 Tax=Rhodohalobacter sp. SW132 TaxID=2293433 RepID=UPI000E272B30|nr:GNAT family N-acyltransferase [Rhodohalobacter sp. SW132]REL37715.1 GNAT family N-acetyltransferase [Rhodohalobacter sp. SW132]
MLAERRVLRDISSKSYTIKIAKTKEEEEAAFRLRYNVFIEELNRDFNYEEEKDKDTYDEQSHHLIVIENKTGSVVGTYRLQHYEQAIQGNGFVTDNRFHLDQFPDEILKKGVEVGRACISKEHRNGRVLYLLWKGFAGYLTHFGKRYLFGYSAFDTSDPAVLRNTFNHFKEKGLIHPKYYLDVREAYRLPQNIEINGTTEIDIPTLMQNYFDVGCLVSGGPSYDEKKLAHCVILLDIETISDRTRKLFFG